MNIQERKQHTANLKNELDGVALYNALAEAEKNAKIAEVYRRLAAVEQRHADLWADKLKAAGELAPSFRPSTRIRLLGWLAKRFGVGVVLPAVRSLEEVAYSGSDGLPELQAEEQSHARLLRHIVGPGSGGMEGGALAQIEGRHRSEGGNALRAAVLGANDGLLSNLSLVMGVAGAQLEPRAVLITGFAGLLAGASSMAIGEWLSVLSSRELYQRQIDIEREEIAASPEEEAEELALIYEAKGLPVEQARNLADQILSREDTALKTLAREELGVDPESLGGSAWEAAVASFLLFAAGAIIPVVPFLFLHGASAVVASLAFSAAGLALIGAAITLFTGRSILTTGLRQVVLGLAAAGITFGIGHWLGIRLGG